jgi:hypothetical protein
MNVQDLLPLPTEMHVGELLPLATTNEIAWFVPGAENYFDWVSRPAILAAIDEAQGLPRPTGREAQERRSGCPRSGIWS